MKIFKSLSVVSVMLLLMGANAITSSPSIEISADNVVSISGLGNNVLGVEVSVELSSGSFNTNAYTSTTDNFYSFGKTDSNVLTIYVTSTSDLSSDGKLILGTVNTSSNAVFKTKGSVMVVDATLLETNYSNVSLSKITTSTDDSTSSGGSNSSGNSSSSGSSGSSSNSDSSSSDTVTTYEYIVADDFIVSRDDMSILVDKNQDYDVILKFDDLLITFTKGSMELIEDTDEYDFSYSFSTKHDSYINILTGDIKVLSFSFGDNVVMPFNSSRVFRLTFNLDSIYSSKSLYLYKYDLDSNSGISLFKANADDEGVATFYASTLESFFITTNTLNTSDSFEEVVPDVDTQDGVDDFDTDEANRWFIINVSIMAGIIVVCLGYGGFVLYKQNEDKIKNMFNKN